MKAIVKEAHEEHGIDRKESTVERFLKDFYKIKSFSEGSYIEGFLLPGAPQEIDAATLQYIRNNSQEKTYDLFRSTMARQRKYLSLDFEDLIAFTLHILRNFPEVKEKWQRKMNYIMVDEVQDCNAHDWEIYEILSGFHGNLFLVGDPDQTIYEWRGAHLEKFLECKPKTDIIMAQNYRSTSIILNAANSIIEHNEMRIPKDLFTQNDGGEVITHFHGKDDRQEADWISSQVNSLTDKGAQYSDFAVLVRSSYLTRAIEQSFMRNKISYVIWGGIRFFERKEIKDSLSYLRLIAFDDDMAFKRIVNIPSRKIGEKSLKTITETAQERGCSLFEALRILSSTKTFAKEPVQKFIELIDSTRTLSESLSISNLLEHVLANSGLNELYRTDEEEERLENLNELLQSIKTYETDHREDDIKLQTYLQDIALYTNVDKDLSKNHVKIMTIHQSKGLEFPYVFIAGLSEGIMPNKRSVRERKKKAMEEERRLMYVAVTRAQKKLFLTESEGYSVQGGFDKVPSRFIREISEKLLVTEGHMDESLWNRASIFSRSMDAECGLTFVERKGFAEGDEVIHDHLGSGVIQKIYDGGEYCEVQFWESGLRSLKTAKLRLPESK